MRITKFNALAKSEAKRKDIETKLGEIKTAHQSATHEAASEDQLFTSLIMSAFGNNVRYSESTDEAALLHHIDAKTLQRAGNKLILHCVDSNEGKAILAALTDIGAKVDGRKVIVDFNDTDGAALYDKFCGVLIDEQAKNIAKEVASDAADSQAEINDITESAQQTYSGQQRALEYYRSQLEKLSGTTFHAQQEIGKNIIETAFTNAGFEVPALGRSGSDD